MSGVYDSADWRAFVAAVRADPAADLPRAAAADWLDDRGECDRAELIRVECEAERFRPLPRPWPAGALDRWRALVRRALVLRGPVYAALGPPGFVRFTRGFVESVSWPAAAWVAHGDALLMREPVAAVALTTRPAYEAYAGTPDVPGGRVRGSLAGDPLGLGFVVPHTGDVARRLVEARWPGVRFGLPDPPADRPARAAASGRPAASGP